MKTELPHPMQVRRAPSSLSALMVSRNERPLHEAHTDCVTWSTGYPSASYSRRYSAMSAGPSPVHHSPCVSIMATSLPQRWVRAADLSLAYASAAAGARDRLAFVTAGE